MWWTDVVGKLLWNWIDSMRSERIAEAVNGLRHGTDVGALVWDGARGHRSRLVDVVGLPTIVQPAGRGRSKRHL